MPVRNPLSRNPAASLALAAAAAAVLTAPFHPAAAQPAASSPVPQPIPAAAPPPVAADAQAILQRFKAATGGAAWDSVRTIHTRFIAAYGGLNGSSDEWDDVVTGRSASFDTLAGTRSASGWDGRRAWHQSDTGPAQPDDGAGERQDAVSDAYDTSNSFWYADRMPGKLIALGQQRSGANVYDVVRVEPGGGTPYEMFFDPATGLLAKSFQQGAMQSSTTLYRDYRTVPIPGSGGVKVPYSLSQTDGDARYDTRMHAASVAINADPPTGIYDMPGQGAADYAFPTGADSVKIPFTYAGDHIYIPIKINGRDELAMFDTGGAFIVSTGKARSLGLKPQGKFEVAGNGEASVNGGVARADTVEIGGLTINKPLFTAIAYFGGESDQPIVGAELLERFVIGIDFDHSTMTFTRPSAFRYTGRGAVVPFRFHDEHMPIVDGAVDGIPGTFTIDTGDNLSLTLNGPYTQANGLLAKYKPRFQVISGYGIGGPDPAYVARAKTFTLGGVTVHDRVTYLRGGRSGAGADRLVSGNVGNGVLHQFNLVFDYPDEQIIFEPNKHYGDKDVYIRTGIIFDINTPTPTIAQIVPNSPAADAGLAPGDVVLSIDGITPRSPDFADRFDTFNYKPAGSSVIIEVTQPNGRSKSVTMVLRDLV